MAPLGAGAMGEVYQARHGMLRRPTAVKLLRPEVVGEEAVARFEREVQLTAQLTHPNTVRIFDYGRTDDGVFYYAMEYLEGADLATVVGESGPLPSGRAVRILRQASDALAEAHASGLIHRDIKPANIFLKGGGYLSDFVKVVDFGLVLEVDQEADDRLTVEGKIAGTPHYMSPETLLDPEDVEPRCDVYALGCVAYFLLTGDHVFRGRTIVEVCGQHLHSEPEPMIERGAEVPESLEALVRRCLAKDPKERPTTEALSRELGSMEAAEWATWSDTDSAGWWQEHGRFLLKQRAENTETLSETQIGRRLRSKSKPPAHGSESQTVPSIGRSKAR